ncbi:MAG: hypothetical protein IJY94_03530 [Clostridia bacterium]|nr:hypothetical protein [Clostridia bacterium]
MKKRVLSLLLACFMVVSTFIISRPVVDVHAVEYTEGVNQWTLPMNWGSDALEVEVVEGRAESESWRLAKQGPWRLTSFTDLDDTSTMIWTASSAPLTKDNHKKGPKPHVNGGYNKQVIEGSAGTTWYTNYNERWTGTSFNRTGNTASDRIDVSPMGGAKNPAVVFTAPSNGVYSYSELLTGGAFVDANEVEIVASATVRVDGAIIDAFTPTATNATKTLEGTVSLKEGQLLVFGFELLSSATIPDHKNVIELGETVVTKIADYTPEDTEGFYKDLTPVFSNPETLTDDNGNVTLMGYQFPSDANNIKEGTNGTSNLYTLTSTVKTNTAGTSWYVFDPKGNNNSDRDGVSGYYNLMWGGSTETGLLTEVGGSQNTKDTGAALVFTAPRDGIYVFEAGLNGKYPGSASKHDFVIMTADGTILDYGTNLYTSAQWGGATLTATVKLNKYEQILILKTPNDRNAEKVNISCNGQVTSLSIAQLDYVDENLPENYKGNVQLPIIFDGTSFTDKFGMVELMGYDTTTGAPYKDGIEITTFEGKWYIYEPDGKSTYYGNVGKDNYLWGGSLTTGLITNVGGDCKLANVGSTLIFTAPYTGAFKFESTMESAWPASNGGAWSDYLIQKEDGTILSTTTNKDKGNYSTNATTVTATVTLTKGEKIYIIRKPTGEGSVNVSCSGSAIIKITAMDHACSTDTLKHVTAVASGCEDGNIEYWACPCGINYADADATTEVIGSVVLPGTGHADSNEWGQSATQHWMYCANGCGELRVEKTNHTWENGVCSVCEYECNHENANVANCVSASVCPVCSVELAPINPSNHALPNSVHANGDGTHRHVRVCCDASSVVTEDCAYDENGICVECGFDGSTLIKIENNIDNAFDNAFNDGNNNVTATGPSAGALDDYKVVESATPVAGAQYVLFNLYANLTTKDVYLRHHFVVTDANVQITVNGNPVTEKSGDNVYYYDSVPVLGKYDVADTIVITDGTNTATYSVSLYSYIKSVLYDEDGLSYDDKGEETVAITAAHKDLLKALYDANEEAKKVEPVYVAMANQSKNQIQIFDLNAGNLNTPVWSYDITVGGVSGFRLREYNGDTVLLVTVGKKAEMYNITTGQRVWYTTNTPDNSHCIEILPNGIIAVGGTVGHDVHFYNLNGDDPTEILYEHPLNNAHGLLWDPDNNVLWATGHIYLQALNVTLNAGGTVTVEINEEITAPNTPEPSTHDLQPYFGNKDLILVSTSNYIFVYNKVTKTYTELVKEGHIKGVSVLENGDILYIYPDGLEELWNSTWINKLDVETGEITQIHSNQGRFYKLLVCNTNYQ